jgi:hypothetical protein
LLGVRRKIFPVLRLFPWEGSAFLPDPRLLTGYPDIHKRTRIADCSVW